MNNSLRKEMSELFIQVLSYTVSYAYINNELLKELSHMPCHMASRVFSAYFAGATRVVRVMESSQKQGLRNRCG